MNYGITLQAVSLTTLWVSLLSFSKVFVSSCLLAALMEANPGNTSAQLLLIPIEFYFK